MKSKKFPNFEEAKTYLKERGVLTFHGRSGARYEYCVYTLTIGVKVFHVNVFEDGLMEVVHERYKHGDE